MATNRDSTGGSYICWIGICWNVGNGGLAPPSLGPNPHAADLGRAGYVDWKDLEVPRKVFGLSGRGPARTFVLKLRKELREKRSRFLVPPV